MSTHRHFEIVLLLCSMSLSYNYRLIENRNALQTCPARNRDILFEGPHQNDHQRNFYNVHDLSRREQPNSNIKEIKSENWLLRIINIKSINQNPSHEVQGTEKNKPVDGFAKRFFNILRMSPKKKESLDLHKNEPKILFVLKKNPYPKEHNIVKREPEHHIFM
ncbi:uncharacterized protein LOC108111747 [Drosophila eugracilis]|uniref:uncharacterized protein LOC108111747 n=1 Tax=Drosophila eugracilis TaxID=29029 RepID=UPI001BD9ECAA|nr:uncharacterized protein LOC108111747 [Drosophila eugracilis]